MSRRCEIPPFVRSLWISGLYGSSVNALLAPFRSGGTRVKAELRVLPSIFAATSSLNDANLVLS